MRSVAAFLLLLVSLPAQAAPFRKLEAGRIEAWSNRKSALLVDHGETYELKTLKLVHDLEKNRYVLSVKSTRSTRLGTIAESLPVESAKTRLAGAYVVRSAGGTPQYLLVKQRKGLVILEISSTQKAESDQGFAKVNIGEYEKAAHIKWSLENLFGRPVEPDKLATAFTPEGYVYLLATEARTGSVLVTRLLRARDDNKDTHGAIFRLQLPTEATEKERSYQNFRLEAENGSLDLVYHLAGVERRFRLNSQTGFENSPTPRPGPTTWTADEGEIDGQFPLRESAYKSQALQGERFFADPPSSLLRYRQRVTLLQIPPSFAAASKTMLSSIVRDLARWRRDSNTKTDGPAVVSIKLGPSGVEQLNELYKNISEQMRLAPHHTIIVDIRGLDTSFGERLAYKLKKKLMTPLHGFADFWFIGELPGGVEIFSERAKLMGGKDAKDLARVIPILSFLSKDARSQLFYNQLKPDTELELTVEMIRDAFDALEREGVDVSRDPDNVLTQLRTAFFRSRHAEGDTQAEFKRLFLRLNLRRLPDKLPENVLANILKLPDFFKGRGERRPEGIALVGLDTIHQRVQEDVLRFGTVTSHQGQKFLTFFFVGDTGVGKTDTAHQLAEGIEDAALVSSNMGTLLRAVDRRKEERQSEKEESEEEENQRRDRDEKRKQSSLVPLDTERQILQELRQATDELALDPRAVKILFVDELDKLKFLIRHLNASLGEGEDEITKPVDFRGLIVIMAANVKTDSSHYQALLREDLSKADAYHHLKELLVETFDSPEDKVDRQVIVPFVGRVGHSIHFFKPPVPKSEELKSLANATLRAFESTNQLRMIMDHEHRERLVEIAGTMVFGNYRSVHDGLKIKLDDALAEFLVRKNTTLDAIRGHKFIATTEAEKPKIHLEIVDDSPEALRRFEWSTHQRVCRWLAEVAQDSVHAYQSGLQKTHDRDAWYRALELFESELDLRRADGGELLGNSSTDPKEREDDSIGLKAHARLLRRHRLLPFIRAQEALALQIYEEAARYSEFSSVQDVSTPGRQRMEISLNQLLSSFFTLAAALRKSPEVLNSMFEPSLVPASDAEFAAQMAASFFEYVVRRRAIMDAKPRNHWQMAKGPESPSASCEQILGVDDEWRNDTRGRIQF